MKMKFGKFIMASIILMTFCMVTGFSFGLAKADDRARMELSRQSADRSPGGENDEDGGNSESDSPSDSESGQKEKEDKKNDSEKKKEKTSSSKDKSADKSSKNSSANRPSKRSARGSSGSSANRSSSAGSGGHSSTDNSARKLSTKTNTGAGSSGSAGKLPNKLKDGSYIGSANGYGGEIKLKVEVSGGNISSIEILSHSETPGYFENGLGVIDSIISSQSIGVDSISGATLTSNGIKNAVFNALEGADALEGQDSMKSGENHGTSPNASLNPGPKANLPGKIPGSTANNKIKVPQNKPANSQNQASIAEINRLKEKIAQLEKKLSAAKTDSGNNGTTAKLKDGYYEGSARGFKSDIKIGLNIKDGKIESLDVIDHGDDQPFFDRAKSLIDTIIAGQSYDVDVVSGATFSSNGIKDAVRNALEEAGSGSSDDNENHDNSASPKPSESSKIEKLHKDIAFLLNQINDLKDQIRDLKKSINIDGGDEKSENPEKTRDSKLDDSKLSDSKLDNSK